MFTGSFANITNLKRRKNGITMKHQQLSETKRLLSYGIFSIQTDRTISANRPDLVVRDHVNKTCILIDVSIPADRNTSLKAFEKISKYKDLEIEIEKSWKEKTKTIPLIVGALGVLNKSATKYLEEIPGKISVQEVQKIALLGTATILRKALSLHVV